MQKAMEKGPGVEAIHEQQGVELNSSAPRRGNSGRDPRDRRLSRFSGLPIDGPFRASKENETSNLFRQS